MDPRMKSTDRGASSVRRNSVRPPLEEELAKVNVSVRYKSATTHLQAIYCVALRQGRNSPEAKRLQELFKGIPSIIEDRDTGILVKCAKVVPKSWDELTPAQRKMVGELITEFFDNSEEPVHRFHHLPIEECLAAIAGMMQQIDPRKEFVVRLPAKGVVELREVINRIKEAKPFFEDITELHALVSREFPHNSLSLGMTRYIFDTYC